MKKTVFLLSAVCVLAFAGCKQQPKTLSHDELVKRIDSIESPLIAAAQLQSVDTVKGKELIELYVEFADAFPQDTMAPYYLHRAAQVANGMGKIDDMVTYYDRVIDSYYTDYIKIDECYYEKGLALDNAGRKAEARKAYEAFLEEFPEHFLADDFRKAIQLLNMSDEMLNEYLDKAEGK